MKTAGEIAVAGATDRIGHQTVEVLRARGHETVAISRSRGVDIITAKVWRRLSRA